MISYLDLNRINENYKKEFVKEFGNFLSQGTFILGSEVELFERVFADYCGTKYCIGVANGLDALRLIINGYINLGLLKEGDKVIVPANTFVATILSLLHSGLQPILVDPDKDSFNLSIEEIESNYSEGIKAIIVVHLYGQLVEMEPIVAFAKSNNILLIEDAAQAHGAIDDDGNRAGNLADAAAFSFYPSKNLGALGDAGGITTNDSDLANELKLLRNYGSSEKYKIDTIGFNSRLDPLQAMFLRIKLKSLNNDNSKRQAIAERYLFEIKNNKLILPHLKSLKKHVFYAFVVLVSDRNHFVSYISRHGIGYQIHYPIPPHKQKALSQFCNCNLPITEYIHKSVVSLPLNPALTEKEITKIITVLNDY